MKRLLFATAILLTTLPAIAQDAQDKVPLTVTRAELQIIGQGLLELPYKTSAGVLQTLQLQLKANDDALAEAAKKAAEAAKPKEEPKPEPAKSVPPPAAK